MLKLFCDLSVCFGFPSAYDRMRDPFIDLFTLYYILGFFNGDHVLGVGKIWGTQMALEVFCNNAYIIMVCIEVYFFEY